MNSFPDIEWTQFLQCCTGDPRQQFEDMTRRLFIAEFLDGKGLPQSETSHPGIEVDPILEPAHEDGAPRKRISFQSKFFDNSVGYGKIKESAIQAAKHYKGELDLIYLFCNLTINPRRSSTYQDTVKLLNEAGIQLKPISGKQILDLVLKHEKLARYYFLPRERTYTISGQIHTTIIPDPIEEDIRVVEELPGSSSSTYHRLLEEKITFCKSLILDLNLMQLKAELNCLHDVENETVIYYRCLMNIHEGNLKKAEIYKNKLNGSYRFDAEWLYAFVQNPRDIGYQEILAHSNESQVILIDELLNKQLFNNVVTIYEDVRSFEIDDSLKKAFTFSYAIALFNLHQINESREELKKLYENYKVPAYRFFYLCADLQIRNTEFGFGSKEKAIELESCLRDLKEISSQVEHLYRNNEQLVGMLEILTYYNLSYKDEAFIELADRAYANYSDPVKKDSHIICYLGLCHEVVNEFEKAIEIYSNSKCDQDEIIIYRLGACLLRLNRNEEAYDRLNNCKYDNPAIVGVKLAAEYRLGQRDYKEKLTNAVTKYGTSLNDLIPIAFYVEDIEVFNYYVKPAIADQMAKNISDLNEIQKTSLLLILVRNRQLSLILKIIKSDFDLKNVDGYIVHQLYDILLRIINDENKNKKHSFIPSSDLTLVENIANVFIESDAYTDRFLHIRLGCYSAQERHFAMLQDSKRLYNLTGDLGVARNIVALLYSQNEKRLEEYEPYLTDLSHSDVPAHAIAVCSGAMRLGNSEMAERFAYKALYLLNGEDNYEIYKNYFAYISGFVLKRQDHNSSNHVSDNMVVELRDNFNPESIRTVCLDSESDFYDDDNHSLGIEHLKLGDANYTKIVRASIGQIVKVFGRHYKIVNFMPRSVYAFRYINKKIQEHPDEFDGIVYLISTKEPQQMIEEMKKHTDHISQIKHLLACYHFEEFEFGIPIEMLCNGDYSRYIDALRMLLYEPDQALYAGIAEIEEEIIGPYVPTLSTLVLLCQIGHMKLLNALRDTMKVIIPESYIEFFEEMFSNSMRMMDISPGKIVNGENNELVIIENDQHIPEMWEEILEWCQQCKCESITTEERASFSFAGQMTGDQVIAAMNLNKIQLDALILSQKREATYISDDLFMRKIATWAGIKNNNFTFLLYFLNDMDLAANITLELSKTNYTYTPIFTAGLQNSQEVIKNLLSGERKMKLYGPIIDNIRNVFLQEIGFNNKNTTSNLNE